MIVISLSCVVGESGPASPGSVAQTELAAVKQIASQAQQIEALAREVEGLTDQARAAATEEERAVHVARIRELMAEVEAHNDALQDELTRLDARLHTAAGDPVWSATSQE